MKKFLTVFFALAMVVALSTVSLALSEAHVYVKEEDEDYYDTEKVSLAPGETGYVFIGYYNRSNKPTTDTPSSIKIESMEVVDSDEGEEVKKMITVDRTAEKKKVGNNQYGWFAKIKVKSVSASNYPEDGYDVYDLVISYKWDAGDGELDVVGDGGFSLIAYEDGDDAFYDEPMLYKYEKEDDVEIELPDGNGTITYIPYVG